MKLPEYIVVTKDMKAMEHFSEAALINSFLRKEFDEEASVYAVKEKMHLRPTALLLPTRKGRTESGSEANG